jgi:hypothetical protein
MRGTTAVAWSADLRAEAWVWRSGFQLQASVLVRTQSIGTGQTGRRSSTTMGVRHPHTIQLQGTPISFEGMLLTKSEDKAS